MTIQSDKWIKKMCLEQNMIEPFIEETGFIRKNFLWTE